MLKFPLFSSITFFHVNALPLVVSRKKEFISLYNFAHNEEKDDAMNKAELVEAVQKALGKQKGPTYWIRYFRRNKACSSYGPQP